MHLIKRVRLYEHIGFNLMREPLAEILFLCLSEQKQHGSTIRNVYDYFTSDLDLKIQTGC